MVKIKNFRQYIMEKITQTKVDKKATKNDTLAGKKKGLDDYQKGYYDGRMQYLREVYDECAIYEWELNSQSNDKAVKGK